MVDDGIIELDFWEYRQGPARVCKTSAWWFDSTCSHTKRISSLMAKHLTVNQEIVGSSPTCSAKHGTYTLRLIRGWKVNRFHVGSIPTVPTTVSKLICVVGVIGSIFSSNLKGKSSSLLRRAKYKRYG